MKLIGLLLTLFLFFTLTFFSPFNLLASYDWSDHFFDQSEPDSEKFKYICDYEPFPEMLISIPHKNFMFHFTEERISKLEGQWVNPGCYKESLTIRDLNKDGKIVYQRKTEDFYYVDATETEFIELGGIDYAFISRYTRGAKSYYGYSFIPLNTFEVKFSFVQTKRSPLILFRKLNTVIECEYDPYWESNEYLYFFTPEGIERSKLNKKEFIQVLKNNYKIKDDFTFCLKDVNWRLGNQGINDFDEYNLKNR